MGNSEVTLTFKTISKQQFQLQLMSNDTIQTVRTRVAEHLQYQLETVKLVYQGKELANDTSAISELEINPKLAIVVVGKKLPASSKTSNSTTANINNNTSVSESVQQPTPQPTLTKHQIVLSKIDKIHQKAETLEKEAQLLKEKKEELGDKKYSFERKKVDEYLTRCLLELDGVDVDGDEELRVKRKNVIRFIQCVQNFIESSL